MSTSDKLTTPLEMASRVSDAVQAMQADSLPEYTAPTRLSPIVLIDKKVLDVDQILVKSLLQTMLSVYTAHYLQAINIAMNVGDVKVLRLLNSMSTDRSVLSAAGNSLWLSNEALDDSVDYLVNYSLEADNDMRPAPKFDQDKTIKTIQEEVNLAIGKLVEVKIASGEHSVSIPINVNVAPKSIRSSEIVAIITANSTDRSATARYHQWRSGEISFIRDYLLNMDLIDQDFKALKADTTGSMLSIRSKRTKGILATLASGQASPNAVSAMVVVSKSTAKEMEIAMRGKLKSSRVRDKYFKNGSTMMLVVVDSEMERFTMYQRGIDDFNEYTLDDIKGAATRTGANDIDSILQAYKAGDAATL